MKQLILIAAAMVAVSLFSCRSKQAIMTESNSAVSVTDTTKVSKDTTTYLRADIDTTKTTGEFSGGGMVEFVECGGKVSIDTAGNVIIEGVKNIKGARRGSLTQDKGITKMESKANGHTEQFNGVTAEQTTSHKAEEKEKPVTKWYNTMFARIGQGVCIALLMWLLFLYLKRKK